MNKRQKEAQQVFLDNEKAVLKKIEENYQDALAEINDKIERLMLRDDVDMQNVIYQLEYQKSLRAQVEAILETLHSNEFETVSEYLTKSYEDGFLGTMYDLQGQGIPIVVPIDQEQVVRAIQHETKLSDDLYTALGKDTKQLSKQIASEISRGISNAATFAEIARNIENYSNIPKNNAMRIARTEAHRIQCKATADAQWKAKSKGADIVKIWDASLDGKTRATHRELDGQMRELDEPFEVEGMKAMQPGDFGLPSEDCNCRCALISKPRWALDNSFTKWDQETGGLVEIDAKDYADFKMKYAKEAEKENVRRSAQKMKIEFPEDVYKVKGFTKNVKEEVDKAIKKLQTEFDIRLNSIVVEPAGKGDIFITGYHDGVVDMVVNENADFDRIISRIAVNYESGYYAGRSLEDYIAHEMAHCMLYQDCTTDEQYYAKYQKIESLYDVLKGVSKYPEDADEGTKGNEALAEAFVRVRNKEKISPIAKILVDAFFGKWKK